MEARRGSGLLGVFSRASSSLLPEPLPAPRTQQPEEHGGGHRGAQGVDSLITRLHLERSNGGICVDRGTCVSSAETAGALMGLQIIAVGF